MKGDLNCVCVLGWIMIFKVVSGVFLLKVVYLWNLFLILLENVNVVFDINCNIFGIL